MIHDFCKLECMSLKIERKTSSLREETILIILKCCCCCCFATVTADDVILLDLQLSISRKKTVVLFNITVHYTTSSPSPLSHYLGTKIEIMGLDRIHTKPRQIMFYI